jgi:hypothetical protein
MHVRVYGRMWIDASFRSVRELTGKFVQRPRNTYKLAAAAANSPVRLALDV